MECIGLGTTRNWKIQFSHSARRANADSASAYPNCRKCYLHRRIVMTAYAIADIELIDSAGFEEYRQRVPATIAAYGGRYIARGGTTEVLEGTWSPKRCVILEFPSLAQLKAWWDSPEYRPVRAIRERTAKTNLIVTEGV
jgi:uncharacterized protein (DUF1330 family)